MLLYEIGLASKGREREGRKKKPDFLRNVNGISLVIKPRLMEAPTGGCKSILLLIHLATISDVLDESHLLGSRVLAREDSHYG